MAGFHYIAIACLVEAAVDRRVKTACDHFGHIALRQQNIFSVVSARAFSTNFDLF
jgi:hypothetical protein